MNATTVAVDLAKDVFELAFAESDGRIAARKRLNRQRFADTLVHQPPCTVVMEACGSAHHWGRFAQRHGHRVLLLPPRDVRPYVRRDKTDRADAAGLLEAARCADIHPVLVKSVLQQEIHALHAVRRQWIGTRTARCNVVRGLLREFGLVIRKGAATVRREVPGLLADADNGLPYRLRAVLSALLQEISELDARLAQIDAQLREFARQQPLLQRIDGICGVGVLTATALWAALGDVERFRRGRQLAAWFGLPPKEHSSGSRRRLGAMSKRGDPALRTLLIHGGRSCLAAAERRARAGEPLTPLQRWMVACSERCGRNKAAVAVANKIARILWAVWRHDRTYDPNFTATTANT